MIRRIAFVMIAASTLFASAGAVDAARGGNGGGAKGTGDTTVFTLDQATPLAHGQAITFTVSTTATDRPMSKVECYQGGTYVYQSTRGHFQDYYDYFGEPVHYLSSMAWSSGDADCTASLVYQARNGRSRTITSFDFHVSG